MEQTFRESETCIGNAVRVIEDNWERCIYEVKEILYNDRYEETQEKCQAFWQKVKQNWRYKIEGKLSLLSPDCLV